MNKQFERGVLPVDKPVGLTSREAVDQVQNYYDDRFDLASETLDLDGETRLVAVLRADDNCGDPVWQSDRVFAPEQCSF